MTLYTKHVSDKGKVTYQEYKGYTPKPEDEISDAQLLTLAVSIAVTCLNVIEHQIPAHKRNARKIKALEQAIFDAAQGHGETVDKAMIDYWISNWNALMKNISSCQSVPPLEV